jgi:hypothetical protein
MNNPILISGIPRSGTSLTAGLIALGGVNFGETVAGNRNNPRGYWESAEVRNKVVKPYLSACGMDPKGQWPLPRKADLRSYPTLREEVEAILGETWAYKEPKLLLMWEIWAAAFPEAKWVVTERDPDEILDSVLRTGFMRAFKTKQGWSAWMAHHQSRLKELIITLDPFVFKPSQALSGDMSHVYDLGGYLGIQIPHKGAQELLEPSLWNRGKGS